MSILHPETVSVMNGDYAKFVDSVRFREGEDFYSEDFPILELSYNENPLGAGKLAEETILRHVKYGHRYPPLGYSVLINELARRLDLAADNVIVAAGSVMAIYLAVIQYADPGDKVIISKSSLPWYRWSTLSNNSVPVIVPLANDMNHDLDAIVSQVDDKTRVVILSNPHNPTGLYIGESELKEFYQRLPENVLFIVDQAYYEYQSHQETQLLDLVKDAPNLMLTRTFSKIHGLAGLRIGYGIANTKIIQALKAKWLAFMPAITSVSAYAAYHALFDEEHLDTSRRFNNEMKRAISELAGRHGLRCLESEGNFLAVNIRDSKTNERFFHENNLAFTAGYFFGYPAWARISFDKRKAQLLYSLDQSFGQVALRQSATIARKDK